MGAGRARCALWTAVMTAAAFSTSVGWARGDARIVGTARNDILRGTAHADVLDGRGGNDRLLGLAGNDILVGGSGRDVLIGGPGGDKLRCGSGKDVARADGKDVVASDCETVTGVPPTTEPPPTETNPPPAGPPPPAGHALPGRYCGFTNQGKSICVTVAPDSSRVTTYRLGAAVTCGSETGTFSFVTFGPGPIQTDLAFSRSADETRPDSTDLTNIKVSWEISGKFDTKGNVTGTFFLKQATFDVNGTHSTCTGTPTSWEAKLGT
jgi:RTX calcium-binding nonapeptide repeat (4 copies)